MLARGTSASLCVGDDRRVVQRVKLYMCVRRHLTACREKHSSVHDRNQEGGQERRLILKQINRKIKMLASVR